MNGVKYCYVVMCESLDGVDVRISGGCYQYCKNAIRFIESRTDNPKKIDSDNPFIWIGERWIYKIHTLTFDD